MYSLRILNAFDRLPGPQYIILQPTHELILTVGKIKYHICLYVFFFWNSNPCSVSSPNVQADWSHHNLSNLSKGVSYVQLSFRRVLMLFTHSLWDTFHDCNAAFSLLIQNQTKEKNPTPPPKKRKAIKDFMQILGRLSQMLSCFKTHPLFLLSWLSSNFL